MPVLALTATRILLLIHWANSIFFGDETPTTLRYTVQVLNFIVIWNCIFIWTPEILQTHHHYLYFTCGSYWWSLCCHFWLTGILILWRNWRPIRHTRGSRIQSAGWMFKLHLNWKFKGWSSLLHTAVGFIPDVTWNADRRTGTHDDDAVQRKERRQRRESATGCELPTRNGTFCPRAASPVPAIESVQQSDRIDRKVSTAGCRGRQAWWRHGQVRTRSDRPIIASIIECEARRGGRRWIRTASGV